MILSKRVQIVALAIVAAVSGASEEVRADKPGAVIFRDTAAIEKWAKQAYFGGASVTKYAKDGRELVVVNGMPTSGLHTSQVVILCRAAGTSEYHVTLKSAVFMGDVKVRQEKDGLTADVKGKTVFNVPFELASLVVHTGL